MKALYKTDDTFIKLCEVEEPYISEVDDVKIKVKYATLSSEDRNFNQESYYFSREGIVGHEMCGEIVELGDEAKRQGFKVGDKVGGIPIVHCGKCHLCKSNRFNCCLEIKLTTGTICEYVVWKSKQLVKLEDNTSYKSGCLIENMSSTIEVIEKVDISLGDSVAILGSGTCGLLAVALARVRGAKSITVIEPLEYRREMAKVYGADFIIDSTDKFINNKVMNITDFIGFDIIIDTSSSSEAVNGSLKYLSKGGKLILYCPFNTYEKINLDLQYIYINNIEISTVFFSNNKINKANMILENNNFESLINIEYPFEKAVEAFEMNKNIKYIKIGIKMP
ncbi:MAG: alcohol dehydrogenase catalytic domain-containing protein [Terrisporobacter sp.]|uniref:zinc-dependent alcohol dehydrogenase n=1 Tax=Terrisporobacter sp. TaxID=1965305 RepID=UPI002FC906E2